jgi:hypothetical protein
VTPQKSIAHYLITAKLGEGGEAWRATETKLNRDVAIKLLPPGLRGRLYGVLHARGVGWRVRLLRVYRATGTNLIAMCRRASRCASRSCPPAVTTPNTQTDPHFRTAGSG